MSKDYIVDYYYCDPSPYIGSDFVHPPSEKSREEYLKNSKVNLIKFNVEYKDVTDRNHKWINTDFWEFFNSNRNKYSLILATTAGPPEYPFTEIQDIPIVNILTLGAGVSNQENIIIETNEFEDVDVDVDVDEDEDEVDELDDDDEDEELDELDDALSEGGSIDEVSDSESLLSDLSDNSKLMD